MKKQLNLFNNNTKLLFLSMFYFLLFTDSSNAQDKRPKIFGGMGFFMTEASSLNLKDLNNSLSQASFPTLKEGFFGWGGGGHAIISNVIIGGEGFGYSNSSETNDSFKIQMSGGKGAFNIGYVIKGSKRMLLYSILGIGGGGLALNISEKPTETTFNNLLNNPRRGVLMENGYFLLTPQVGLDFFLGTANEKGAGGWVLGIRAGYNFVPGDAEWEWENKTISSTPLTKPSGPFVRLVLGGGGYGKVSSKPHHDHDHDHGHDH